MGTMVDATNPDNIPPQLNGKPAVQITVAANSAAVVFDVEEGNAPADEVAAAVKTRYGWGRPSVAYVNESTCPGLVEAVAAVTVPLRPVGDWPQAGVYLWTAAPGVEPGQVPTWAPVAPVAVQDVYTGAVDQSTTFGDFGADVAGYLDGPVSAWPGTAWERFTIYDPAAPPSPAPIPAPQPHPQPDESDIGDAFMFVAHTPTSQYWILLNGAVVPIPTEADGSALTGAPLNLDYVSVSDDFINALMALPVNKG